MDAMAEPTINNVGTARQRRIETRYPFAALNQDEIRISVSLINSLWPETTELHFKVLTLQEPDKDEVLLQRELQRHGQPCQSIDRRALVGYYLKNTNKFHEATVNLSRRQVERHVRLGANIHAPGDGEEIIAMERIALEDEGVREQVRQLQLPEGTVVVSDPWIYGSDGVDDNERMYQCFLYLRDPRNPDQLDSNHYAFPLPISPVISAETRKVVRIDRLPTGVDNSLSDLKPWKSQPSNEYVSEGQQLRQDLKPLNVVQPEGASFQVEEGEGISSISWQKWNFQVGFNQREGMVLYNVQYDGRSLFYRVSLSDMNIPYADPRQPYHRKSAFDLGDAGAGVMANNLKLGCDCLGSIYYLSGLLADEKGKPLHMPNVICIHEQDAGIGWKHTNYRTGRAAVVRSRELVVQSIITVANYEYILAFVFNQAAEMHYEVRATGILSTQPIDEGIEIPFGTVVHPGVLAVHHQHIFSLRIDPHLDGSRENRLVYSEAHPLPIDPSWNPHGNGYVIQETLVEESCGLDLAPEHNRTFKIQNTAQRNQVNGLPVGYKIVAPPFQPILSHASSFNFKRAEFANHNIYTAAYRDGELYAGGQYTNQSRGGTGVASWAARRDNIVDKDFVVYVQFGMNHIPRVEDFPVMPCEILRVALKPVHFFNRNPAIDVPPSEQRINQSVGLNREVQAQQHAQSGAEMVVVGSDCCSCKL